MMSLTEPERQALGSIADGLAAAGLAAVMAGATIFNATVLHNTAYGAPPLMTALLCAVFALLAYGRRRQINALWAAIRR